MYYIRIAVVISESCSVLNRVAGSHFTQCPSRSTHSENVNSCPFLDFGAAGLSTSFR